jgi:uncharacterized protein (TIGR03435 family)
MEIRVQDKSSELATASRSRLGYVRVDGNPPGTAKGISSNERIHAMLRTPSILLLSLFLATGQLTASSQAASNSDDLRTFDAATIKPPVPGAGRKAGFYGEPGGRVFFGGTIRMLVMLAFNLRYDQVTGDQGWAASEWFEINAVPPETSPSRQIRVANAEPSPDQRLMLQSLLHDRFGFKSHIETKDGEVYILSRGSRKPLQLKPPKDPAADPRAIVAIKQGEIVDGEAQGVNATIDYLARRLSGYLRLPVLNETGIAGSYDFNLPADDPENKDVVSAVFNVVDRLGLKIKRGRGPIQTLVIDHVQQPSEN